MAEHGESHTKHDSAPHSAQNIVFPGVSEPLMKMVDEFMGEIADLGINKFVGDDVEKLMGGATNMGAKTLKGGGGGGGKPHH